MFVSVAIRAWLRSADFRAPNPRRLKRCSIAHHPHLLIGQEAGGWAEATVEVLHYMEFLDYKITVRGEVVGENAALWAAVKANQSYKRRHPEKNLEAYATGVDFLEAVKDL